MIDELISKGKMNELVSLVAEHSRMSYFGAARQVLELARWGLAYEESWPRLSSIFVEEKSLP